MAIFYWTIQLDSITPPSALEVKLGQDGVGSALPATQKGQITDTGQASPIDGLPSTPLLDQMDYLVSWVWDDGAGELRGPVSAVFTTLVTGFPVNGDSTQAFTLGKNSAGTLSLNASSVKGFSLGYSATAALGIAAVSVQPFALGYASDGTVSQPPGPITGASSKAFTLGYSATGAVSQVPISAASSKAFTLVATSTGTVSQPAGAISGASTQAFALGRTSAGALGIATTSIRSFTIAGSGAATVSQPVISAASSRGFTLGYLSRATTGGLIPGELGHIGGDDAWVEPWSAHRVEQEMEEEMLLQAVIALHVHGFFKEF